jgi:hypothetical protein
VPRRSLVARVTVRRVTVGRFDASLEVTTQQKEKAMASRAGKVLELVVFNLKNGVTHQQLLATNDGVSGWARRQSGFISRELSYDAEGDRWIDIVWWKSIEHAQAAAAAAMTSASCAPMFALIDTDSTWMIHAEPVMSPVGAEAAPAGA